jgi:DNA-binding transcriptional LysR family regulator
MDASVKQIRSFIAVAKARSFTQAAATLHMSQPTLTVQIRRLEEALGVRLLDRNSRAVDLTRIGRELLPVLERNVQDLDAVLLGARELADEKRGIVRIAVLPSFAAGPLPDAILSFRETHPGVTFQVHDVIAGRGLGLVRSEEVDLAVLGGEATATDIEVIATMPERLVIVFPQGHPIAKAKRIMATTLAAYPLVLMHPDTSVRAVTDAAFAEAHISVSAAAEATYMMTAVAMVRAGLGLAILPETAREIRAELGLASRVIDERGFLRPISLVKKAGRTLPPASTAFLHHLGRLTRAA